VVVARHLPPTLKADLRELFLRLSADPAMQAPLAYGFIERFVAVEDSSYDDIRAMLVAAEAAGFTTLA
jgi:ABC-type phosphate/phosphonate transport system substrate-binding protein